MLGKYSLINLKKVEKMKVNIRIEINELGNKYIIEQANFS